MTRRPLFALLALPLVLALAACDPGSSATPSGSSSSSSSSSGDGSGSDLGEAPEIEVPADAGVLIQGTVTADSGAVLDLALIVYPPTNWNSPAAPERPALMTAACAGYLDESVYEMQGWNFVRVDVVATLREGSDPWPSDAPPITIAPTAEFVALASEGFPGEDPEADSNAPHCDRNRVVTGPGEGTFVFGLSDDIHLEDTAANGLKWTQHSYGFTVPGVVLAVSDCSITSTPLAESAHWPVGGVPEEVTDAGCRYGAISVEAADS